VKDFSALKPSSASRLPVKWQAQGHWSRSYLVGVRKMGQTCEPQRMGHDTAKPIECTLPPTNNELLYLRRSSDTGTIKDD